MTSANDWTAPKAASRLVKVVKSVSDALGTDRFPINVESVALESAKIFGWSDPIAEVRAAAIGGFQGALVPNAGRSKWLLLYNDAMPSPGRVRFTQAHELGHYILHRIGREQFQCGEDDVLSKPRGVDDIESQADEFASYLLMPIDDFREQVQGPIDLDSLSRCAKRYGVSITAVILKWLQFTDEKAVMAVSRDGFIKWSWSTDAAFKSHAFIRTRLSPVEIANGTVAADDSVRVERVGKEIPAKLWFPSAPADQMLREMKVTMDSYEQTLSLLLIPKLADYWPSRRPN